MDQGSVMGGRREEIDGEGDDEFDYGEGPPRRGEERGVTLRWR